MTRALRQIAQAMPGSSVTLRFKGQACEAVRTRERQQQQTAASTLETVDDQSIVYAVADLVQHPAAGDYVDVEAHDRARTTTRCRVLAVDIDMIVGATRRLTLGRENAV